jgi:flagellar FliL protein
MSEENARAAKSGSLLGRLLIAAFMGAVIVAECGFAYLWLPSADEVAARTEEMAKSAQQATEDGQEEGDKETKPVVEVDLGTFSTTAHRPNSNATLRVDFHLIGTVQQRHQSEFVELYKRNEHRFRDNVLVEIRNSEVTDLTDPGLGLIKRRILEKSNALFGTPVLRSVVFSEFSFVEH